MTRTCADCPSPISRQAKRCRSCAVQRVNGCPDVAQARREAIRAKFADPAHRAKMRASAQRASTARVAKVFDWCPPEYLDQYRHLSRNQRTSTTRITAVDARRIIIGLVKADRAKLSPFERQERALRRGVGLVANSDVYRDVR